MHHSMSRLDFQSVTCRDPDDPASDRHRRLRMPFAKVLLACMVVAGLAVGGRTLQQVQASKQVPDPVDVDRQLEIAQRLGQRVVIYFHDPARDEAVRMEQQTWQDVDVIDQLGRGYRFVRLDPTAPNYRAVLAEYELEGAPAIVIMASGGTILTEDNGALLRVAGFVDAPTMHRYLEAHRGPALAPKRGEAALRRRLEN